MTAPDSAAARGDAPPRSGTAMPALLALAVAIVAWSFGDDWRREMDGVQQQLNTAAAIARRGTPQELTDARSQAERAVALRDSIETLLRTDENVELVRARLTAELRRACIDALAANCVVRLADDSLAARSAGTATAAEPASRGASGGAATLEALNVQRARATVSGVLQEGNELAVLMSRLQADPGKAWRLNRVVVTGNTFELDVERLVRSAQAAVGS